MDCSCRTIALRTFVRARSPTREPPRGLRSRRKPSTHHAPGTTHHNPPGLKDGGRASTSTTWRHQRQARPGLSVRPADPSKPRNVAEQAASDSDKKGMEKEGMAKKRRDLEIKRVYGAPSDADEPKPKKGRDPKARRAGPAAGDEDEPKPKEEWKIQKEALKKKFPEGWKPRKKLSPDAMAGIRMLHEQFPDEYTTPALANKFEVSPEAIRRILKSDWRPKADEEADRDERWFKRGKSVWTQWAALGKKPPRKWRAEGIVRDPVWNKPRGPTHKKKDERAEAQRRLAWAMKGMEPPPRPAKTSTASPA
ncbi:hypothetical protein C8A05DRAFT_44136 [Staphylotrichum tortipilum]|uniref:Required for respiratory growth protein 9, mitochondrial n=1 Tax=Staphylotrichum tortipilum TaxID=2831512 RepID=A0AAN6MM80_9PEZI|nr:hypothetical protein C8A05DRAFT_44136 [Staphylotrichum longicolle]